jgi:hypothetical protein
LNKDSTEASQPESAASLWNPNGIRHHLLGADQSDRDLTSGSDAIA